MRRNRTFEISDVLLLLEMSEESLMTFVRELSKVEYVKEVNSHKNFRDRTYKLIKNTGIICPAMIKKQKKLYDRNIGEFFQMGVNNGKSA